MSSLSEKFLEEKRPAKAFELLHTISLRDRTKGYFRRAVLRLLRSIPLRLRWEVIRYDEFGNIGSFGVVPFGRLGFIATENSGTIFDGKDLFRSKVAPLSFVWMSSPKSEDESRESVINRALLGLSEVRSGDVEIFA